MLTTVVGVAADKILAEVLKYWQALGLPLLQIPLQEIPDWGDQAYRHIGHGIDFPDIHIEILISETKLPQSILVNLKMFNIRKLVDKII